jgi:hypothetical protein
MTVMTTTVPAAVAAAAAPIDAGMLERVISSGDLSGLTPSQRVAYYRMRCEAAGLDFRAQPFQFVVLQGKLTLYATKAAAQQLTGKHGITVEIVAQATEGDLRVVTVRARTKDGRTTDEIGAVGVKGLAGEPLANAYMRAVTKAKRRAILALCGLGEMDETEVESAPTAARVVVDLNTGALAEEPPLQALPARPWNGNGAAPAPRPPQQSPAAASAPVAPAASAPSNPIADAIKAAARELRIASLGELRREIVGVLGRGDAALSNLTEQEARRVLAAFRDRANGDAHPPAPVEAPATARA